MTNGFLVLVPHERLHGTISILKQRPELPMNVCKVQAVKDVMPLIAYRTTCTGATAGESLALQACLAQQAGNGSPSESASMTSTWKEAWEFKNIAEHAWKEPCKICAQLGPLGWSCPWGYMQTIPNVAMLHPPYLPGHPVLS